MSRADDRLFTPRFFLMCGYTFSVFLSAFQLLPVAPFRILQLGGSTTAAGLFLGFLTYSSAFSAPLTGALADRVGRRNVLIWSSLIIGLFAVGYAWTSRPWLLLGLALIHGVAWSGLLSASGAYTTDIIPASRRAEGIGYWGLSNVLAVAVAPSLGLWLFGRGWGTVCFSVGALTLVMAGIAWLLPDDRAWHAPRPAGGAVTLADLLEWRVTLLAGTLFLYAFGYGGVTSFVALYAETNGVVPRGLWFAVFAAAVIVTRPFSGKLADEIGHVRVLLPCLVLIVGGYLLLAFGGTRGFMIASAIVFGVGFGSAYPVFAAYVMQHVPMARRAAAFGGILAALDTGIGSGSMSLGWIIQHHGYGPAYAAAAIVAACSIPYFLIVRRRWQPPRPVPATVALDDRAPFTPPPGSPS